MRVLTIDCKTGKKTRNELTREKASVREAESIRAVKEEEALRQKTSERKAAITRLRETEVGRDMLLVLGIDK